MTNFKPARVGQSLYTFFILCYLNNTYIIIIRHVRIVFKFVILIELLFRIESEITVYSSEESLGVTAPAKETQNYWRNASQRLPLLSGVALKYLGIPATLVPSERVFSSIGYIISNRRASLKPAKVNQLSFLHYNWHM